jgi:hypothetical protein
MNGKAQSAEWLELLDEIATEGRLVQASFSAPRRKDDDTSRKLTVRPVKLKNGLFYQFERQQLNKVFHENVSPERLKEQLQSTMERYKQALFKTQDADIQVLANKKGQLTLLIHSKGSNREAAPQQHNRNKTYVLPDGEPVPFLISLGVMTVVGRVVKAKYD